MSTTLRIPPEFDAASSQERLTYVQELWNRIAETPEQIDVPAEHKRVLDERLEAYHQNPDAGRSWDEVREEILAQLRDA